MQAAFTRNRFLYVMSGAAAALGMSPRVEAAGVSARLSSSSALEQLLDGNHRYRTGRPIHTEHTARREETAGSQQPFAIVLSCSDSRVPPEFVFDQGIGDLFVVRVAGNVATDVGIGSVEYAVSHFGSALLVILGHTKCGAVSATVDALANGGTVPGQIAAIVDQIAPAARASAHERGDKYLNATKANARAVASKLKGTQPIIAPAVAAKKLEVVPMLYALDSGEVTRL